MQNNLELENTKLFFHVIIVMHTVLGGLHVLGFLTFLLIKAQLASIGLHWKISRITFQSWNKFEIR